MGCVHPSFMVELTIVDMLIDGLAPGQVGCDATAHGEWRLTGRQGRLPTWLAARPGLVLAHWKVGDHLLKNRIKYTPDPSR